LCHLRFITLLLRTSFCFVQEREKNESGELYSDGPRRDVASGSC